MKLRKMLALLLALALVFALAACNGSAPAGEDTAEDSTSETGETGTAETDDTAETEDPEPEDPAVTDTAPEDEETEAPTQESAPETPSDGETGAQAEIPQDAQDMLPVFDSILLAVSDGVAGAHSAAYTDYFWSVLYYMLANHGDLLMTTGENNELYVRQSVQECAAAAFGDYSDLPIDTLVPEEHGLSYDEGWDAFGLVWMSDRSATETTITAWSANGEDNYTAEAVLTGEDGTVIASGTFTLMANPYADGITDPLFLYTVTDAAASAATEATEAAEGSGELVGLADSHSVEILVDGEPFVFQCSEELAAELGAMDPGVTISFSYTTDTATGAYTLEELLPTAR
ncbi:MAG TPA: hypothetical protein IAC15_10465 [Candidatus Onthomonas avicola]|nr:hypothetical protein [Candidatus Onthomonas avicola]